MINQFNKAQITQSFNRAANTYNQVNFLQQEAGEELFCWLDTTIKPFTIVDLGCGDFKCGKLIYNDLDILYTGYDTYKKVIDYNSKQYSLPKYSFIHLDFFNKKESIIKGDLCILKDVLQHWKMDEIYTFLDYLVDNKLFKYIFICNCCKQTEDNPKNDHRSTPLSINFFPLKKYNPIKLYNYNTKEVSVISIN